MGSETSGTEYIELPTEPAASYLRERISTGQELTRIIADRVDFTQGMLISTLPRSVSVTAATSDFEAADLIPLPRPKCRGFHVFTTGEVKPVLDLDSGPIRTMITDWLSRTSDGLCVFDDATHGYTPDSKARAAGRMLLRGEDAYMVLNHGDVDDETRVALAIRQMQDPELDITVLTREGEEAGLPTNSTISSSVVEAWADKVEAVLLGGYHMDAHLAWIKTNGVRWLRFPVTA